MLRQGGCVTTCPALTAPGARERGSMRRDACRGCWGTEKSFLMQCFDSYILFLSNMPTILVLLWSLYFYLLYSWLLLVKTIIVPPLYYTALTFTFTKLILYFSMSFYQELPFILAGKTTNDVSNTRAITQLYTQSEEFISLLWQQYRPWRGITDTLSSSTNKEFLAYYATPMPKPMPII